jgi:hypothetical protein
MLMMLMVGSPSTNDQWPIRCSPQEQVDTMNLKIRGTWWYGRKITGTVFVLGVLGGGFNSYPGSILKDERRVQWRGTRSAKWSRHSGRV